MWEQTGNTRRGGTFRNVLEVLHVSIASRFITDSLCLFSYFLSLSSRHILMTQCTCSRMCCRKSTVVWSQDSSTIASEDPALLASLLSHLTSQRFLSLSSFLHCQFLVEQSLAHRLFYLWISLCFPSVLDFGFSLVFYSERVGRRKVCLFVLRRGFAQLRLSWNSLHC